MAKKNCIQCVVHVDEGVKDHSGNHIAGAHHMHYTFIPAVQNKSYMKPNKKGNITKQNTFEEKVSSDALLNKKTPAAIPSKLSTLAGFPWN